MSRRGLQRREFLALAISTQIAGSRQVAVVMRVSDAAVLSISGASSSEWLLPPGSSVKPFVLQALLDTGKLRPDETFLCRGGLRIGAHDFTCSHPLGLPPMDVAGVIAYSCNAAVVHFANRFEPGELANLLRRSGFRVAAGNPLLQALGEDGVLVTPLELAGAYRQLAQHAHPAIIEGMEGAVQYGTARNAAVSRVTIAGKTGSATTNTGLRAAFFAGFAPSRGPQVAVVVATEGRSGGADAAPVAARLFRDFVGETYRVRFADKLLDLPVEQYVAAVLAGESSVFRNAEALKAMAVVARTFAAHQRGRHAKQGFDFCNTTHCQRAEPDRVTPRLREAARTTDGEMLWFEGRVAFTPYTMNCGGVSESVESVWPEKHAAYLSSHADPYCQHLVWSRRVAIGNVERALREAGLSCPRDLKQVSVVNRTASGRARQLSLQGRESVLISAGAFRFAVGRSLGWNLVPSDWFELSSGLAIRGRGEGHGLGLCQAGADRMAAAGRNYQQILAFYYPGASTTNWVRMGGEGVAVYATDPVRDRVVVTEAERMLTQLPWPIDAIVLIYVHPTLDAFRNATNEPGWVAAISRGSRIDMQPLSVLQTRGILRNTLRHEFLHIAVEGRAHAGLPVWFREGLVECLAGATSRGTAGRLSDTDIAQREDRRRAQQGYQVARARVAELIERHGEETVLGWVSRGLPEDVTNSSASTPATKSR